MFSRPITWRPHRSPGQARRGRRERRRRAPASACANDAASASDGASAPAWFEPLERRLLLTDVAGSIVNNTTWTLSGSPWNLTSDVRVEDNATLTIESGAVVTSTASFLTLFAGADGIGGNIVANNVTFQTNVTFGTAGAGTFTNNSLQGAHIAVQGQAGPTFTGNVFNQTAALSVHPEFAPNVASNSFFADSTLAILNGTIDKPVTWPLISNVARYRLDGEVYVNGGTLTIASGNTVIESASFIELSVSSDGLGGNVIANDVTFAQEIVFGNGAGGALTNSHFTGSGITIQAQAGPTVTGNTFNSAVTVSSHPEFVPKVANNTFAPDATIAVVTGTVDTAVTWPLIANVARYRLDGEVYVRGGALTVASGNTVVESASFNEMFISDDGLGGSLAADGVTFRQALVFGNGGGGSLTNNTFQGSSLAFQGPSGPIATGNTFAAAVNVAAHPEFIPNLADNTFAANTTIGVLDGIIDDDSTWPKVDNVVRYRLDGDMSVRADAVLTIDPLNTITSANTFLELRVGDDGIGGTLLAQDVTFQADLYLQAASKGSVTFNTFIGRPLTVEGGTQVVITQNNFANGSVVAFGDESATINMEDNAWGTDVANDIEDKILHQVDDNARPLVDFIPFLSEAPQFGPEIDVQGNGQPIARGDDTPDALDGTAFAKVFVGQSTATHQFTIQNVGTQTLALTGNPPVSLAGANAGDFVVTLQPQTALAPGGGSTTLQITFDPTAAGLRTATVVIPNDDADEGPYFFSIAGQAGFINPPVANDDTAATTQTKNVVIDVLANDSDSDGTLQPASVTITKDPGFGGAFVNTQTGAITYQPNGSFTGTDTFTYTVRDDDGLISNEATVLVTVQPIRIGVDGMVVADNVGVVNFGASALGQTGQRKTFTVTNIDDVTLSIDQVIVPAGFVLISVLGSQGQMFDVPGPLAPGDFFDITIAVMTDVAGEARGRLIVRAMSPNAPPPAAPEPGGANGQSVTTDVEYDFEISGDVIAVITQPMAEVGQVTGLRHTSTTVTLSRSFDNPVVFAQPLSVNGSNPSVVRISDVQSDQFTVFVQESSEQDGNHFFEETVSYIVMEQGLWELPDGTLIEVGAVNTDATTGRMVGADYESVAFTSAFSATPVVMAQVQTYNDTAFIKARQRNVTTSGFEVTLEPAEADTAAHGSETIGYVAMDAIRGSWDDHLFESGATANAVTSNLFTLSFTQSFTAAPNFLGALATRGGADSAELRYDEASLSAASVQFKVEEDYSLDNERTHGNETVHYLAIEGSGVLEAIPAAQFMGEVGQVDALADEAQTVTLTRSFSHPVVFAQPLSLTESEPAVVRVSDVQADQFTLFVEESPEQDGTHTGEAVSYVVLEAGLWTLDDGTQLEVGTLWTDTNVGRFLGSSYDTVNYLTAFGAAPAVLTQVQTFNDSGFVKTRMQDVNADSFDVALEPQEAATTPHDAETIGYLAIDRTTSGDWSGHAFESADTGNTVTSALSTITFTQVFATAPRLLGSITSANGLDSIALRYDNVSLSAAGVDVLAEEDQSNDIERFHTGGESVGYLAIEGDGILTAQARGLLMGQIGIVADLTDGQTTVLLDRTFTNPVVFAQPLSNNEAEPAVVRISDVQSDRFTLFVDESEEQDASHAAESVSFIVLEAGQWQLDDGTVLEVGTLSTDRTTNRTLGVDFQIVTFDTTFITTPALITQVQSFNDATFVKTRQRNTSTTGFQVTLEPGEGQAVEHGEETIGYLAIDKTIGTWSNRLFETATATGITSSMTAVSFTQTFPDVPRFVASVSTVSGFDSVAARFDGSSLSATGVDVKVEEDQSLDAEQSHGSESVDYLAIAGAGLLAATHYTPDSDGGTSPAMANPPPADAPALLSQQPHQPQHRRLDAERALAVLATSMMNPLNPTARLMSTPALAVAPDSPAVRYRWLEAAASSAGTDRTAAFW